MGKYARIGVKMLKNRLFLAVPLVPTTLHLHLSRCKKLVHVSGFQKYLFFPLEQIFLELFSFTHATLFLGRPVHILPFEIHTFVMYTQVPVMFSLLKQQSVIITLLVTRLDLFQRNCI